MFSTKALYWGSAKWQERFCRGTQGNNMPLKPFLKLSDFNFRWKFFCCSALRVACYPETLWARHAILPSPRWREKLREESKQNLRRRLNGDMYSSFSAGSFITSSSWSYLLETDPGCGWSRGTQILGGKRTICWVGGVTECFHCYCNNCNRFVTCHILARAKKLLLIRLATSRHLFISGEAIKFAKAFGKEKWKRWQKLITFVDWFYLYFIYFVLFSWRHLVYVISSTPFSLEITVLRHPPLFNIVISFLFSNI